MFQEQQQGGPSQFRAFVGWAVFIASALSASVEVFLHKPATFGERYLNVQAAAVLLILPFCTLFWPGHDPSPLFLFLMAYLGMCLVIRISGLLARRRGGSRVHTYYSGQPRVMRFTGRISERTVKAIVEPMITFFAGVLILPASEPLGGYLMLAAAALLMTVQLSIGYDRRRVLDMHDAAIDQKDIVDQFRDLRGE